MGRSSESFFEYNLTRPYPFRYFTLFACVFVVIWLAIITVINVLTQGYILVTMYSTDWAGIQGGSGKRYDGIIATRKSSCQSRLFEVGKSFRNINSGLLYTLAGFE